MVYRLAVCDDEKTMLRQLSLYLEQFRREREERLEIFYYSSAEELLAYMPRDVHAILLDISMGTVTGMECAKRLRSEGFTGEIMFITGMTDYALEGYEVHAFAFLTKPVSYGELKAKLEECFRRQASEHTVIFPVESGGGIVLLRAEELIYAEVFQHQTVFHCAGGRDLAGAYQLSELEKKLAPCGFFRCHRSYLVNMRCIKKISSSELTMEGDAVIPMSRYRYKEFLNSYTEFMGVRLP